jgi:hypothetical protein
MALGSSRQGGRQTFDPPTTTGVSTTQYHKQWSTDPHIIQIPGGGFPHAEFDFGMWVRMQAIELRGMHTGGRGGSLQLGRKYTTFKFLAPEQIIDTHNHDWQEYASIQSRILEKVVGFKTAIDQGGTALNTLTTEFKNAKARSEWPSGERIANVLSSVGDVRVPRYKIDTPLRYTNSQRRQYQLTFILADADDGTMLQNTINLLQKYAAPSTVKESQISINFPYIFSVNTEPEVLVTWQAPYVKGRPIRCELTLSFTDMSPLFQKTITEGGIVNVNTPPRQPRTDQKIPSTNEELRRFTNTNVSGRRSTFESEVRTNQ